MFPSHDQTQMYCVDIDLSEQRLSECAAVLSGSPRLAAGSEPRHGLYGSPLADRRLLDPGQESVPSAD